MILVACALGVAVPGHAGIVLLPGATGTLSLESGSGQTVTVNRNYNSDPVTPIYELDVTLNGLGGDTASGRAHVNSVTEASRYGFRDVGFASVVQNNTQGSFPGAAQLSFSGAGAWTIEDDSHLFTPGGSFTMEGIVAPGVGSFVEFEVTVSYDGFSERNENPYHFHYLNDTPGAFSQVFSYDHEDFTPSLTPGGSTETVTYSVLMKAFGVDGVSDIHLASGGISPVPEPSSWTVLIGACLGIFAMGRRWMNRGGQERPLHPAGCRL